MSLFTEITLPVTAIPPSGTLLAEQTLTVEVERVVPTRSSTQYLWLCDPDVETVIEALEREAGVESVTPLDRYPDRALVRVRWHDFASPFFDVLADTGVRLVEATGTSEGWKATITCADEATLASFYERCRERGIAVDLQMVNSAHFEATGATETLSPVQREILETAFEAGYFEIPREATVADLAARLDRSEQAVSEGLRRGLANYLGATVAGSRERD